MKNNSQIIRNDSMTSSLAGRLGKFIKNSTKGVSYRVVRNQTQKWLQQ